MQLALLTPYISSRAGGLKEAVLGLARALTAKQDLRVNVLSVDDGSSNEELTSWDPVRVQLFGRSVSNNFRYAPELAKGLIDLNPDVTHTHGLWTYLSLAVLRWRRQRGSSARHMVSPHGMLDPWALNNSRLKKRIAAVTLENRHLTSAACLHAVSEGEADAIRKYGLKNPICVISNGVDLVDLSSPAPAPSWDTSRFRDRKVLLYLGRLHPKKGLPLLLQAWSGSRRAKTEWMLAIAGWDQGGHLSVLRQMARELEIEDSVFFAGPLFGDQRSAAYRKANAFVLPSFSEGQPLTVLEAWAHRLPVLMTPACNLSEGFAAGAAVRIEPDIESVRTGLEELVSMDHPTLGTIGQAGQQLVARNYSWPKIAEEMSEVYRWIAGGGSQPGSVTRAETLRSAKGRE